MASIVGDHKSSAAGSLNGRSAQTGQTFALPHRLQSHDMVRLDPTYFRLIDNDPQSSLLSYISGNHDNSQRLPYFSLPTCSLLSLFSHTSRVLALSRRHYFSLLHDPHLFLSPSCSPPKHVPILLINSQLYQAYFSPPHYRSIPYQELKPALPLTNHLSRQPDGGRNASSHGFDAGRRSNGY